MRTDIFHPGVVMSVLVIVAGCNAMPIDSSSETQTVSPTPASPSTNTPPSSTLLSTATTTPTLTPTPTESKLTIHAQPVNESVIYSTHQQSQVTIIEDTVTNKSSVRQVLTGKRVLIGGFGPAAVWEVQNESTYLKVGSTYYTNLSGSEKQVDYRLLLIESDPSPANTSPIAFEDLSSDAQAIVNIAFATKELDRTISSRKPNQTIEGYYHADSAAAPDEPSFYTSIEEYEHLVFNTSLSQHSYIKHNGTVYRIDARLIMSTYSYSIRRLNETKVNGTVVRFENLSASAQRFFAVAAPGNQTVKSTTIYRGTPHLPEYVRKNGTYYAIDPGPHGDISPISKQQFSADRVSESVVYEDLSVLQLDRLAKRERTALQTAIRKGTHSIQNATVAPLVNDVLNKYQYVVIDERFYHVYRSGSMSIRSADVATVWAESARMSVTSKARLNLTLSKAPAGLSGYKITLTIQNGTVANITSASYSSSFGITSAPKISTTNSTVTLKAADLTNNTKPGATNITLATVIVRGTTVGTTHATLTIKQMDDDSGRMINTTTVAGTITVHRRETS